MVRIFYLSIIICAGSIFSGNLNAQIKGDSLKFHFGTIAQVLDYFGNPPIGLNTLKFTAPYHRFHGKVISTNSNYQDVLPIAYGIVEATVTATGTQYFIKKSTQNFTVQAGGTGQVLISFLDETLDNFNMNIYVSPHTPKYASQCAVTKLAGINKHQFYINFYDIYGGSTAGDYSFSFKVIDP